MAEAPAVMTAAGMEVNPDGTITYGNDNEGVRQLRENLPVIGAAGFSGFLGGSGLLYDIGKSAAAGIDMMGKFAMPSTFLKGAATYIPKAAGALETISPWLDAGALSLWSAQAGKTAIDAGKRGDAGAAAAMGTMAALPLMPAAVKGYESVRYLMDSFKLTPSEVADLSALAPAIARLEESPSSAAKVATKAAQAATPYAIEDLGGGYMLKSLMRGNPLEKQLGKAGTVNVNNIKALINKGSKVEQAVVDKVLASEEFAGKKSIDYNKFRKAVQDELITYDRTPNTKWSGYGLDRIGLSFGNKTDVRNAEDRMNMLRERIATGRFKNGEKLTESDIADAKNELEKMETFWRQIPEAETYTFSSSRIPNGSAKHYDANTLGHSRTYTTSDEPDVLHVMESQSDWGQGYKKMNLDGEHNQKRINSLERRINNLKESINSETEGLRTEEMNDGSDMSPWFADSLKKQIEKDKQLLEELTVELDIRRNPKLAAQQDYLAENFTSRQIQENLRYAAEKGQTKMRYPTKETAAKIEGYPEVEMYVDENGVKHSTPYEFDQDIKAKLDAVQKRFDELSRSTNESDMPEYERVSKELGELSDAYTNSAVPIKNPKKVISYANEHEGILKKYDAFPKQFKKLYKDADVHIVTDSKGNTWYEVDVPENYLKQEWQYAGGGNLNRGFNQFDSGGGDMAQMMGAVGPEYMSSLANSATAYPAVETVNVNPSQEDETQVWQIPQYGHVPEYSQPVVVSPAIEPAPVEEPVFDPTAVQAEYDSMLDNILLRQRYAESGFNDRAVNKSSGAAGAYQIMPIAYKDYLQRGRGKEGDLMNAAYNRLVRDHVIKMAPKDLGKELYTDRDTALERHAKEMAVFNAGGGTVRKALRKAVNAGMDITSSFDWLQFLPKETRDYVNFIVLGQEIENSGKNEEAYQAALEKFNNRHDLGGLVNRINKAYGGDRKKMSDAFGRIKAANKFDGGGDKDGDKYVEETDPNFIGPVLPTYSGGNMNAAVASASLPSIQTAHGKRIAHNMAKRVVASQMQMGQVPRSYRSYVEGEAKGAIPMTDFMNTAGKYAAAGTAATVAAPWLLSLAATAPAAIGTELGTYGNIYGNLARTMLMDAPAFDAADRIPTLWGVNRLTVQGGNLAERGYRAVMPESRFTDATAPFVNQAGQFVTGMPVGMAGHGLMQGMHGALRPVDNFIYSRRLMDNYSRERLAADEAGDTESIKSIDALITKGASKGDITGLSYYRGNEPGDLGSTASVMNKIGSDSKRLAPGHRLSLISDYDLSKDSYPLLQRVLLRNQRNGVGDIRLVTDNGVPRMIKLNSDGTGKGSLSAIDKGIDMLRTELGNPDIPGRVSLFGTHYVPAIEFYKYPIPAQ